MKKLFLKLLISFLFFNFINAKENITYLKDFYPKSNILKYSKGEEVLTIPIADRWKINKAYIHLEYSPSKNLVKERSSLVVFFNGVVVYKKRLDPDIDIYKTDIPIPLSLIDKFNKLKIMAIQHYCMNCCENEVSNELWTQIFWKSSYLYLNYNLKKIKNNSFYYAKYVMDNKKFTPFKFGIITENKDDFYINLAGKLSSYIGSILKYRKIFISSLDNLVFDKDIFLIGTKNYVSNILNIKGDMSNVFVVKNPINPKRAIIVITADSKEELKKVINSFIAVKPAFLLGKDLNINSIKIPKFRAYDSPLYIPNFKKVFLSDLGYKDFKFFNPSYFYDIKFYIPSDIFRLGKAKFIFHMFYNYGPGVREDSVINIFVNDKFITSLKIDKKYGTILEDEKLKIPIYLLKPGENKITVQYGLMPPGAGFCVGKNYHTMQGTLFSKKSYILIPALPHWVDMPHLEFFTTTAYPFSIYPDLKNSVIFISNKDQYTLSSLYTILAYMGEKIRIPFFRVKITSDINDIEKNKHILAIGTDIPSILYKNTPIEINDNITLKIPIIKKVTNLIQKKLLGETEYLRAILKIKDKLNDKTIITEGKSPFKNNKVVLIITSNSSKKIFKTVKSLYTPKFVGKIKGDLSIIDNEGDIVSVKIGDLFYIGSLPFLNYLLFTIGFDPILFVTVSLMILIFLVFIVKKLLDYRVKKRLKGEI